MDILQADAIISKLQIADKQVNDSEPTLLISADTVCSLFFSSVPPHCLNYKAFISYYSDINQYISSENAVTLYTYFSEFKWEFYLLLLLFVYCCSYSWMLILSGFVGCLSLCWCLLFSTLCFSEMVPSHC